MAFKAAADAAALAALAAFAGLVAQDPLDRLLKRLVSPKVSPSTACGLGGRQVRNAAGHLYCPAVGAIGGPFGTT